MNKIYIFYLMCLGVCLSFFATYFSITSPDYSDSIFFIVVMILLSSILLLLFLEGRVASFTNKLLAMSFILLFFYLGLAIAETVFVLTSFGVEVVRVFSVFFFMCSAIMMLLSVISLSKENVLNNQNVLPLLFTPVLIFSVWVLFNSSSFSNADLLSQTSFRLFIVAFSSIYSFLVFFNLFSSFNRVLTKKVKYYFISFGLLVLFLSCGFRLAGLFSEISSLFSVIGSFIICLGAVSESSLALYGKIFTMMIFNLNESKRRDFLKFLKNKFSKDERLNVRLLKIVRIVDNPLIPNSVEKGLYEKIMLSSFKWYRKNVRGSSAFLGKLKKFYNSQVIASKRLENFLI